MHRLDIATSPVIAAPMAGGPTTPTLVAAASTIGSLGFVPGGYRSADQLQDDLETVSSVTANFGVNLFVPDARPIDREAVLAYREVIAAELTSLGVEMGPTRWDDDDGWDAKVELLVDRPVPWVSFTFGLPDAAVARRLRAGGSRLLITVTDVEEARAAAGLEPDGLIVQSAAAGGHRGTFDQRQRPGGEPLVDLVDAVVAATDLPVVAAGGLATRHDVRVALEAGAEAVAVGTALLLADEAGTRPTHRTALTNPSATTTTMRAYTGRVARGIRTAFSDRYEDLAPVGYPAVHHLTAPMRRWAAENGDAQHLHLWAGTGHNLAMRGTTADLLQALEP